MNKTLLILGAGASKDFSDIFPLGSELIKEINYHFITEKLITDDTSKGPYLSAMMNEVVKVCKPDEISDRFKMIKNALWEVLEDEWKALRKIDTIPPSIDSLVSRKISTDKFDETDKNIIKCCIYYLIKGFEQAKAEQKGFECNWIYNLAGKVSKFEANEIIDNLSIITFNYDRVFDHYFCKYLVDNGIFDEISKQEFLKNNVQHVYGSLGNLSKVQFELRNDESEIIKHFYKDIELLREPPENPIIEVPKAETFTKVHFVGFGYDDTNLTALTLKQFESASFSGTAYKFSANQRVEIKDKIPRGIELHDLSCSDYINRLDF